MASQRPLLDVDLTGPAYHQGEERGKVGAALRKPLLDDTRGEEDGEPAKGGLFHYRTWFAFVAAFGFFNVYAMRVNLSVRARVWVVLVSCPVVCVVAEFGSALSSSVAHAFPVIPFFLSPHCKFVCSHVLAACAARMACAALVEGRWDCLSAWHDVSALLGRQHLLSVAVCCGWRWRAVIAGSVLQPRSAPLRFVHAAASGCIGMPLVPPRCWWFHMTACSCVIACVVGCRRWRLLI